MHRLWYKHVYSTSEFYPCSRTFELNPGTTSIQQIKMAEKMKAVEGIDRRWIECLQRHYPIEDPELGDSLLIVLGYIAIGSPEIWSVSTKLRWRNKSALKSAAEVQRSFLWHKGDLPSVVSTFQAWLGVPKRERLVWCMWNYVSNTTMSGIEDVVVLLRKELQPVERRRTLRSAVHETTPSGWPNLERLGALLLKVFPDCFYVRWHSGKNYVNCTTTESKAMYSFCARVFEDLEMELPKYVLVPPNGPLFRSKGKLFPSFVVSEAVAEHADCLPLFEKFPEIQPHLPVQIQLPSIGDAVVMQLVGTNLAKKSLEKEIHEACSQANMLLSLKVEDPTYTGSGWKIEIHCPEMYHKQVQKLISEKIRVIMQDLEIEAKTICFPDKNSKFKFLVSSGGQAHAVPNGQHLALIHVVRPEEQLDKNKQKCASYAKFQDSDVEEYLDIWGKYCHIEKSEDFPTETTLWGAVWFECRSTALLVRKLAECDDNFPGNLQMILFLVDSDAPHFSLDFCWWKPCLKKNNLELTFDNKKEFNRFKDTASRLDSFHFKYSARALKVLITSDEEDLNLMEHFCNSDKKLVSPASANYTHQVEFDADDDDPQELSEKLDFGMYFMHPNQLETEVENPDSEGQVIRGTFFAYSLSGLIVITRIRHYSEFDQGIAIGSNVYMSFKLPKNAFETVKDELKNLGMWAGNVKSCGTSTSEDIQSDENTVQGSAVESEEEHNESDSEGDEQNKLPSVKVTHQNGNVHVKVYVGYEQYDHDRFKPVPKLLKPSIMHVRSDTVAFLLETTEQSKKQIYVQIMDKTNTFIQIFKHKSIIHVYGTSENVTKARQQICCHLSAFEKSGTVTCPQPQPQKPQKSTEGTQANKSYGKETMCSVCMSDIDGPKFCLSLCGHSYCPLCFKGQIDHASKVQSFPIRCAKRSCNCRVLTVDIEAIHAYYHMSINDFYMAAIADSKTLFPCLTPGCPMKYQESKSELEGLVKSFTCPLCKETLCTSCHCKFHDGLSCKVYQAYKTMDAGVEEWIDEDRNSRKLCPSCLHRIEKPVDSIILRCENCDHNICWLCLQHSRWLPMTTHRCFPEDAE